MPEPVQFTIETVISSQRNAELLDSLRKYHLLLHPERFKDVRRGRVGDSEALRFSYSTSEEWTVQTTMRFEDGLQVSMVPTESTPPSELKWLKDDLTMVVRTIEKGLQQANITLIWVKGEKVAREEMPSPVKRTVGRLFSNALLLLNVVLFGFNIFLFILFGIWAVVAILGVQFLLILFADRVFARMGKWKITRDNPQAFLLQVKLSQDEVENIKKQKVDLLKLKQEVYEASLAQGRDPSCLNIRDILLRYGIVCGPENITTTVVNVYDLVERAARRFDAPVPKIVISNSFVPNAAASGVSPKRGVLLLTGGILIQLSEEELLSVIGHEIGHLKGRDPLFLYALVSGEFLLRLTILFPLFLFSPFLYLIISLGLIFFIAKFFEARADLLSAMVIGQPKIMAESLRKIGFQRLPYEKRSPLASWLRWDTHPPLYFRIERLERMSTPPRVKHPLLQSAHDVIRGFRSAF